MKWDDGITIKENKPLFKRFQNNKNNFFLQMMKSNFCFNSMNKNFRPNSNLLPTPGRALRNNKTVTKQDAI